MKASVGKKATRARRVVAALAKAPSGVPGLDLVLEGGFAAGRTTLLVGGPGCGKSIVGLQSLVKAAEAGEPGVFVAFEERPDAVRANAATLGWDLAALEAKGRLALVDARPDPSAVVAGEASLSGLVAIVSGVARRIGARRLVLDAVDAVLRFLPDARAERNELLALSEQLLGLGLTTLMTIKRRSEDERRFDFLDYLADAVLLFDQRVSDQFSTRRLRVLKFRGSPHGGNEYPFVIGPAGAALVPLSASALRHGPLGAPVPTGHPEVDRMLGGGYRRSAAVLIAGPSGTGKTTFASLFARAAARRGERVLWIGLEESESATVETMRSSGTDLAPAVRAGRLRFVTAMPEAMSADLHLVRFLGELDGFDPHHVVVDAISAIRRMGSERDAFDVLIRLVSAFKSRGVTSLLLSETGGRGGEAAALSGADLSSVVDTILLQRYVESAGVVNRALLVVKARGARHSNQWREYRIDDDGVRLFDVAAGEGGAAGRPRTRP